MEITKKESEKLSDAWKAVYAAYNALEDLRPGGGFKTCIKEDDGKGESYHVLIVNREGKTRFYVNGKEIDNIKEYVKQPNYLTKARELKEDGDADMNYNNSMGKYRQAIREYEKAYSQLEKQIKEGKG